MSEKNRLTGFLRERNLANTVTAHPEVPLLPLLPLLLGQAAFVSERQVRGQLIETGEEVLVEADEIFINTGAKPRLPELPGLRESRRGADQRGAAGHAGGRRLRGAARQHLHPPFHERGLQRPVCPPRARACCGSLSLFSIHQWLLFLIACWLALLVAGCTGRPAPAGQAAQPAAPTLQAVYQSDTPWTGIAISDDDRAFVLYPRLDGEAGLRIAELRQGRPVAYPDAAWNSWQPGAPTAHTFVRVNALRIGPDGRLWVVDTGTPRMGGAVLPGGPKLVAIDLATNRVVRTIPLDAVVRPDSFVDDLRFWGNTIYLTDAGSPALLVLDAQTGRGRRVFEHDPSTTARQPPRAEGEPLTGPDGRPVLVHADQLEVSPDGRYLYFQPVSGPLRRVETRYLNDAALPAAELSKRVEPFYATPSTGGTAIDAAGNIYVTDVDQKRILRISPQGQARTLVQDERLIWAAALWLDHAGNLWIPAAQLNRLAPLHGGRSTFWPPVYLYKLPLGARPFRS